MRQTEMALSQIPSFVRVFHSASSTASLADLTAFAIRTKGP